MRSSYFTKPRRTSSIDVTVGFREVVGRNDREPFCNWRARLAATMINRYVLVSGSSGITNVALRVMILSDNKYGRIQ